MIFKPKQEKSNSNQNPDKVAELERSYSSNESVALNDMLNKFIEEKSKLINAVERGIESKETLKRELSNFLKQKKYQFGEDEIEKIYRDFEIRIWGYGLLQPLIDDKDISDIRPVSAENIRIKKLGKRMPSGIKFDSEVALKDYILNIAVKNGVTLNETDALQIVTDTTSSSDFILRIDLSGECVNSNKRPYMHIRKIPKHKDLLPGLKAKGMFDGHIEHYLNKAMHSDLGMLICGKNASGKTTLMNALIEEIPHNKSAVVVQESAELFSSIHPELICQLVKKAKGESKIAYSFADLIRNGLLVSDFDYVIIGELKGDETWDLANASHTGHVPMASVHSMDSEEAPGQLIHYMKGSPNARDTKDEELMKTLLGFDCIVFMKDFKVNEITEIAGFDYEKGNLIFNPVFKYKITKDRGEFIRLNESCEKVQEKIDYSNYVIHNTKVGNH